VVVRRDAQAECGQCSPLRVLHERAEQLLPDATAAGWFHGCHKKLRYGGIDKALTRVVASEGAPPGGPEIVRLLCSNDSHIVFALPPGDLVGDHGVADDLNAGHRTATASRGTGSAVGL
jgi:hypothetical protein